MIKHFFFKAAAFVSGLVMAAALLMPAGAGHCSDGPLRIATTTSTQASGLLELLIPAFEKDTGIEVHVIAKGTGAAIRDGKDGNVDLIFVHDPDREAAFVAEGFGTRRCAVMHNDFIVVGPPNDPAGIGNATDAVAALEAIARKKNPFVSRGDDSGTHAKEQDLWQQTDLSLKKETDIVIKNGRRLSVTAVYPEKSDGWYMSIGQGMGKTLIFADEKRAYTLSDRGTYLNYRYGKDRPIELAVLFEGDPRLNNPYGVIPVNPEKHPHVNAQAARRFAEWLTSKKGQSLISGYKLHGQALFFPDAE